MGMFHLSAVLVLLVCCILRQSKSQLTECLSNKDCPSDRLCAEFQCINPCLLNLCDSPVDCKVTNHIPVCSSKCGPSCTSAGTPNKNGVKKFQLYKDAKVDWFSALVNCSSQGMALATIDSQQEHDRLVSQVKREDPDDMTWWWWLGGSDLLREGQFVWNSIGKRFKFNNFADGDPNNFTFKNKETEHCVGLSKNRNPQNSLEWYDGLCSSKEAFICEYFD